MKQDLLIKMRQTPLFKKENKRSLIFKCPSCGKDSMYSVEKTTGRGICYAGKCGIKTKPSESVRLVLGLSKEEAKLQMVDTFNATDVAVLKLAFSESEVGPSELTDADFEAVIPAPTVSPTKFYLDHMCIPAEESPEAMAFLASRGVTELEKMRRFDLRHHPVMRGLLAPVYMGGHAPNETDGFQTRLYSPKQNGLKVVSCPGMLKSQIVLNYLNAMSADAIAVAEGIFDCLKADMPELGIVGVATFGKAVSAQQIELLKALPAKRIYLALDRDAFDLIAPIALALGPNKQVFRILPPMHRNDIGECTSLEVAEMYRMAEEITGIKTARLELWVKGT